MKKMLFAFLVGVLAGWGAYWYVDHHQYEAWRAKQVVLDHVEAAAQTLEARFSEITAQAVKEQLARTGVYVVDKAKQAGAVVADAATDARITASIKARLFNEPNLSAMAINVDTAAGVVTLSGTAKSHDEIAKIIQIAAATEGVRRIISTVQVKAP